MSANDWYVAAAYGVTLLVLGALMIWLYADYRARQRELAGLEAAGQRRRSDRAKAQGND